MLLLGPRLVFGSGRETFLCFRVSGVFPLQLNTFCFLVVKLVLSTDPEGLSTFRLFSLDPEAERWQLFILLLEAKVAVAGLSGVSLCK